MLPVGMMPSAALKFAMSLVSKNGVSSFVPMFQSQCRPLTLSNRVCIENPVSDVRVGSILRVVLVGPLRVVRARPLKSLDRLGRSVQERDPPATIETGIRRRLKRSSVSPATAKAFRRQQIGQRIALGHDRDAPR